MTRVKFRRRLGNSPSLSRRHIGMIDKKNLFLLKKRSDSNYVRHLYRKYSSVDFLRPNLAVNVLWIEVFPTSTISNESCKGFCGDLDWIINLSGQIYAFQITCLNKSSDIFMGNLKSTGHLLHSEILIQPNEFFLRHFFKPLLIFGEAINSQAFLFIVLNYSSGWVGNGISNVDDWIIKIEVCEYLLL